MHIVHNTEYGVHIEMSAQSEFIINIIVDIIVEIIIRSIIGSNRHNERID